MEEQEIQRILVKDYFWNFQFKLYYIFEKQYNDLPEFPSRIKVDENGNPVMNDKNELIFEGENEKFPEKVVKHMEYMKLFIETKNEIKEIIRLLDIYNIAEFIELLKSEIKKPNIDYNISEYAINVKPYIKFYKNFINSLDKNFILEIKKLPTETIKPENIKEHNKIKWIGTPSQFSYIFLELVKKRFIEQPLYRGETSPTRYAELCFNNFEIETTLESLKTEFKINSSLGIVNRLKFGIPEKDLVTDRRSGTKSKKK